MPNTKKQTHDAAPIGNAIETIACGLFGILGLIVSNVVPDAGRWTIALWIIAYLAGGVRPFFQAILNLRFLRLRVDALMIVAAIGAAALGDWKEGVILLFLFSLSGTLEEFATYRTNRSIESLIQLRPRHATRVSSNSSTDEQIEVELLDVHDRIRVRPGERFAIDGKVIEGESWVDESTLTGESKLVHKTIDAEVFSGTMNGQGTVIVEMTKIIADTTLERIVHLVHEAQSQKTPTQRLVESWQQPYVIGVFAAAAFVYIAARLVHTLDWEHALYHAMVLLVAASPCAVVVSSPSVMLSAIALAGRHGLLFKGAAQLEMLGKVDTLALDKTGTVTQGRPVVTEVWSTESSDVSRLLALAATVEKQSEHPLAIPVLEDIVRRGISTIPTALEDFHSHTGLGVHARVNGVWVGVGRESMFEEHHISIPSTVLENAQRLRSLGQTALIVIAVEEKIAGVIGVADTLRPEAVSALRSLKNLGIQKIVLLTGDHERVAQAIAKNLGVDEVRAGLLPEAKVTELRRLAVGDHRIAMVGDGVNDAPALAIADVGIAMGGAGTDVALEVADVVLMRDNLRALPMAVWISRLARKRVRQNMIFAFGTISLLVLATFFSLPLWLGVLGHEGSTVLVVFNGLRMLWERVPKFE